MNKELSIKLLNDSIAEELHAVDQYLYFHFHCEDMGYDPLAKIFYTTAITEMRHVDMLAKRVLFLKGDVEMRRKETVQKIHEPKEMIAHSKNLEQSAIDAYNKRVKELADNMDSATKKLIENIIVQEDGHWDGFDTEEDNFKNFGDKYLVLQAIEHSKKAGKGEE